MSSDGGESPGDGGRRGGYTRKIKEELYDHDHEQPERIGGGNYEGPVDEQFSKFHRNLIKERERLDPEQFPNIHRLIQAELDNVARGSYGVMAQEPVFIDLYNDPPITLVSKAMPPTRLFPKFNYAGRIIGPKGAYLKALMKETSTKMVLLGKGVMKDKDKEEELRRSNDPKYLHLNEDMHVCISVTASASEAYKRMAYAIASLKEQVLSDNRTLETLPWITGSSMNAAGPGRSDFQRYPPPRSSYPITEPVSRSHRTAPPPSSYDYDRGSPPGPVYRHYPHEMSPPPVRRDSLKSASYGDSSGQWRSMETSRGSEYERRPSTHGRSRSPIPSSRSYPPATAYDDPYAYAYADSYYPPVDAGAYAPMPSRGGKVSSSRYAPYKK